MKYSCILLFLFLAIFPNCRKSEPAPASTAQLMTYQEMVDFARNQGYPISKTGLQRNWDEVLALANVFGLKDRYKDQERENNALMFMTEEQLNNFFKKQHQDNERQRQRKVYIEKGQKIQTLSDYFNLLDSLPLYRINRYPSDEEYAALKKKYFSSNYQFFINEAVQGDNNYIPPFLIVVTKSEEIPQEKARRIEKR